MCKDHGPIEFGTVPNLDMYMYTLTAHRTRLNYEALQEVLGSRGTRAIFSKEQGSKGLKISGTGEHRQFWGTENIENQDFVSWEQGNKAIFSEGNKGTDTPL